MFKDLSVITLTTELGKNATQLLFSHSHRFKWIHFSERVRLSILGQSEFFFYSFAWLGSIVHLCFFFLLFCSFRRLLLCSDTNKLATQIWVCCLSRFWRHFSFFLTNGNKFTFFFGKLLTWLLFILFSCEKLLYFWLVLTLNVMLTLEFYANRFKFNENR